LGLPEKVSHVIEAPSTMRFPPVMLLNGLQAFREPDVFGLVCPEAHQFSLGVAYGDRFYDDEVQRLA
jgi:hypothetical protein